MKHIAQLAQQDRPREKLLARGVNSLSDVELLAVLLGSGTQKLPVLSLAQKILKLLDERNEVPLMEALTAIPGVGPARAAQLAASMEFARRRIRPTGIKIRVAADLLPLIRHYADRKQEYLLCTTLNGASEVIATRVITVGLVNKSQAHPREIFADAVTDRAAAIILSHNHPSGKSRPSREDKELTQRVYKAGELLGIRLVDHIIFTHDSYYSFLEDEALHE